MAKDILKEAIADAKAVREVALANAKAALEEAFTPKLQSMLSAKLSEDLDEAEDMEEIGYGMEEDMDERMYDEDMDETVGMEKEEKEMEEDLDEEINLEEILSELELEEAKDDDKDDVKEAKHDDDKDVKEAKDDVEEEKLDEMGRPIYKADDANYAGYTADRVHEGEEFDLDSLLKEINDLEEEKEMEEADSLEEDVPTAMELGTLAATMAGVLGAGFMAAGGKEGLKQSIKTHGPIKGVAKFIGGAGAGAGVKGGGRAEEAVEKELEETKAALETVRTELNEVNLLNSKLLYVNRIFKVNQLDESQKLRVVETLDKADSVKEAKLIYETIKDTFNVANAKKESFKNKTKSLKEGIGMASKAAGTSTAPKQEVISESSNMVNRFQKLANIKINE